MHAVIYCGCACFIATAHILAADTSSADSPFKDAVIHVAEIAGKSVVSISAEHTLKIRSRPYFGYPFGDSSYPDDTAMRDFFEEFFGRFSDREIKNIGLGSGVIVDAGGYILTNEHIIANADKITVTLSDGRTLAGTVSGRDQRSDLAVIKIEARDLPVAKLGNSDSLRIGEWVVAIGNPFGFALENPEPTVTVGVVSALHRSLGRIPAANRSYDDLIQTDAAINPGNSGGPLVNLDGEIVGINTAIFSTSGGSQGIGFAIPANQARRIIGLLIEGKKIAYGWLGITAQNLSDELAAYFGADGTQGVVVARVFDKSPAQKARIKEGDVITSVAGRPVRGARELVAIIGGIEIGRTVEAVILRDKKTHSLPVQITERPQEGETLPLPPEEQKTATPAIEGIWRGVTVDSLFQEEESGVRIAEIEPGSAAQTSGLLPGDVIVEVNKRPVVTQEDFYRVAGAAEGDVLIKTKRGYFLVKESGQ